MTLGEWLEKWLTLYVEPGKLAPSSKAMYRRAVHAVPAPLLAVEMATLTALDLLPWLLDVAKVHPRAAQLDRQMLAKALNLAAKLRLCPDGIVDRETLPKPVHTPKTTAVLDAGQAAQYLRAAMGLKSGLLLVLCLSCGLRRGEALGLRWSDLELNTGVMHVERQRMRQQHTYKAAALKSANARRALMLPAGLVALLDAAPRTMTGWVVDVTPERLQADHMAALAAAHLPHVTVHGLRHTMATLAAGSGVSIKILQASLGHASYKLTADLYAGHALPPSSAPGLVWAAFAG